MCKYCKQMSEKEIHGEDFKLEKTSGYTNKNIQQAALIMKGKKNDTPGIIIFTVKNGEAVYFEIDFCPMCGRKLEESGADENNRDRDEKSCNGL